MPNYLFVLLPEVRPGIGPAEQLGQASDQSAETLNQQWAELPA
jgi:hypothetical protein